MKKTMTLLLLMLLIVTINGSSLNYREKIELNNVIEIIQQQPNKPLTQTQTNILKKYIPMDKDPFVQEKMHYLTDTLKFNIEPLKEPAPITQKIAPIQPAQPLQIPAQTITISEKPAIIPETTTLQQKQEAQPIKKEIVMTPEELQKKFTELEAETYKNFYYNKKEGLLTLDGIQDIINSIKKDNAALTGAALIDAAHKKATTLLATIKKQTTLDTSSAKSLKEMIKSIVGHTTTTPSFTLPLTELKETRPMKEYDEPTPTSFTSTIGSVIESIENPEKKQKNDTEEFIKYSKEQGKDYYFKSGSINPEWLNKAAGYIINGKLTESKKADVVEKLSDMVDILIAEPLSKDTNISDDEYEKIIAKLENTIDNFVAKLTVGTIYRPSK